MVMSYNPSTMSELFSILEKEESLLYAGGTDLMVKHKSGKGLLPTFDKPLLFLGNIEELRGIEDSDGMLTIKAATTLTDILNHENTPEILKKSLTELSSSGIRNLATLGGNICNASPAGDTLPALYALEATLTLSSLSNSREIPVSDFIKGPGMKDLGKNEILTKINIPQKEFSHNTYRKTGTRKANALSKLSFAGLIQVENSIIKDIRMALGAVAPTVIKSKDAENMIKYKDMKEITTSVKKEVLDIFSQLICPINDQRSTAAYRKQVSLNIIENFINMEEI